jgi:hypothetical protein
MQVLLAPVLLDLPARRKLSTQLDDSGPTSNDLLRRLVEKHLPVPRQNDDLLSIQTDGQHLQFEHLGVKPDRRFRL